jgi:L-fuculose-phosphate aldolase
VSLGRAVPPALRREVEAYAHALHARGWVANHDGNVSARLSPGGDFVITPTAISKRLVSREALALCGPDGAPTPASGKARPPSEVALHALAYRARPDVGAVVHAHPVHASAFALLGRPLEPVAMPEIVVSLGPRIPVLPTALPKDAALGAALTAALAEVDVVLLGGNGVLAVGDDLEQAYLRVELVEHYAQIFEAAARLGAITALPEALVAQLVEARTKAGLGPGARAATAARGPSEHVRRVVAEELKRALRT